MALTLAQALRLRFLELRSARPRPRPAALRRSGSCNDGFAPRR